MALRVRTCDRTLAAPLFSCVRDSLPRCYRPGDAFELALVWRRFSFPAWRRDFSYLEGPSTDSPLGAISACGEDYHPLYDELQVHLDVTTYHTGESATIRFEAVGSDRGGYFGVQDLQILAAYAWPSPPQPPSPPGRWEPDYNFEDRWPGATGWSGSASLAITNCDVLGTMLGGYQVLGSSDYVEKTFTGLPPHSTLRVQLIYTRVDRLQTGVLLVDGAVVWRRGFNYNEAKSTSACGTLGHVSFNEIQDEVDVAVDHSSENVTVRVAAEGGDSRGYFGIQDVKLLTGVSHPSPPAPPSPP